MPDDRMKNGIWLFVKSEVSSVFKQLAKELREEEMPHHMQSNEDLAKEIDELRETISRKVDEGVISLPQLSKLALKKLNTK